MKVEHKITLDFDDLLELLKDSGLDISEHAKVDAWVFDMPGSKAVDMNDAEIEITWTTPRPEEGCNPPSPEKVEQPEWPPYSGESVTHDMGGWFS